MPSDYPTFEAWWSGHGALPVPEIILPQGWIAFEDSLEIAASFIYIVQNMTKGKLGVIEWTTTNPKCSHSRKIVEAVPGLYRLLERYAFAHGCIAMLSFVKPNSGEERIMERMGYVTSDDDKGHRIFSRPLVNQDKFYVPPGGVLKCPSR
jgi:hypothetical protein